MCLWVIMDYCLLLHFGRFPQFASDELFDKYRGHVTRGGKATEVLQDLVKRTLSSETVSSDPESEEMLTIKRGAMEMKVFVGHTDATKINDAVSSLRAFPGCSVVFLNLPKVNKQYVLCHCIL